MKQKNNSFYDNTKQVSFPKKDEKLAEFIGIVLGDGNLNAYKKGKRSRTYMVRIAGHSIDDYKYMTKYVASLASNLFKCKASIYIRPNCNGIYVTIYGKKIIEFFSSMKLIPGDKIKNKLLIPKWIFRRKSFMKACLRGLYDTDGSIYELLPNWPGLYQLNFDNYNFGMLKQVRNLLIKLGFHPSRIHGTKTKNGTKIDLTRKGEIKKFYKEIGTKNDKHKKTFEEFI